MNSTYIRKDHCTFHRIEDRENDPGCWYCNRCHTEYAPDAEADAEACCADKRGKILWVVSCGDRDDYYSDAPLIFKCASHPYWGTAFETFAEAHEFAIQHYGHPFRRVCDEMRKLRAVTEDSVEWHKEPSALKQLAEVAE